MFRDNSSLVAYISKARETRKCCWELGTRRTIYSPFSVSLISALSLRMVMRYSDLEVNIRSATKASLRGNSGREQKNIRRTWFLSAFDYKIIDHHHNEPISTSDHKCRTTFGGKTSVNTGDSSLGSGFLIPGGTWVTRGESGGWALG